MKFKYWLTSLTDISNAKKKLLYDCSITAEKLFFMPKHERFDILCFTDEDRKLILESRASYDVEKEWILFQQKDIGFVTMEDEAYPDKHFTFKVNARRARKNYPLESMEINAQLGERILNAFPETRVDVHKPEVVINVEIRNQINVYSTVIP